MLMSDQKPTALTSVKLIGIAGPKGSGKSTLANEIRESHQFFIGSFATPMKRMLVALGVEEKFVYGDDAMKSLPLDILDGQTSRHALQTLGTEWGRTYMGENFWINRAIGDFADDEPVVFDDVRFENEAETIRDLGGVVVRINSTYEGFGDIHSSERGITNFDYTISNVGTPEDMLDDLVAALFKDGRTL